MTPNLPAWEWRPSSVVGMQQQADTATPTARTQSHACSPYVLVDLCSPEMRMTPAQQAQQQFVSQQALVGLAHAV